MVFACTPLILITIESGFSMFLPRLAAFVVTATFSFSSHAVLLDYGSYSTDTATNLSWLDVTQTAGISYFDMRNGAGGWLDQGWRFATGGEVSDLFSRYVGTGSENWYSGSAYTNALSLVRQLGVSVSFNNSEGVRQIYGPNEPTQISIEAWFDDRTTNATVGIGELVALIEGTPGGNPSESSRWVAYSDFWYNEQIPLAGFGSFLVKRSASVPEPKSLVLLLAGLAVLNFSRRRRNRACIL